MMEVTAKAKGSRTMNTRQNRLKVSRLCILGGKTGAEIARVLGMTRHQVYALMNASSVPIDYLPMRSVAEVMRLTE